MGSTTVHRPGFSLQSRERQTEKTSHPAVDWLQSVSVLQSMHSQKTSCFHQAAFSLSNDVNQLCSVSPPSHPLSCLRTMLITWKVKLFVIPLLLTSPIFCINFMFARKMKKRCNCHHPKIHLDHFWFLKRLPFICENLAFVKTLVVSGLTSLGHY